MKHFFIALAVTFLLIGCTKEDEKLTAQVKVWIENDNSSCYGAVLIYPDEWSKLIDEPLLIYSLKDTIEYEPETCWNNKPTKVLRQREFIWEVEAGKNLDILVTDSCQFEKKLAITAQAGEIYLIPVR